MQPDRNGYDFSRCKLCGSATASPKYLLTKTSVYACPVCDFHYINHLDDLSPAACAATRQLDQRARNFIEAHLPANEKQQRTNLRLVAGWVSLPGMRCLDIGAGAGLFARLLSEAGASVYGIEPQGIFRAFAQERFGIELRSETLDTGYWQQDHCGFFDLATLWDVFEHVNFPAELLQQAYAVLKPGGVLFLDTPLRDALFYRIAEWSYQLGSRPNPLFLESIYSPLPFRHKQIFTQQQLQHLMERSGFSVQSLRATRFRMQNKAVLACRKPDHPAA